MNVRKLFAVLALATLPALGACKFEGHVYTPTHAAHPVTSSGPCAGRDRDGYNACMFELALEAHPCAKYKGEQYTACTSQRKSGAAKSAVR